MDQLELPDRRPLVTCEQCGRRFELAAGGRPRVYCSDACRMVAYRARIKERDRNRAAVRRAAERRAIEDQHERTWLAYLMRHNLSRRRAVALYRALLEDGMITPPSIK